jgi:hypothetical protein
MEEEEEEFGGGGEEEVESSWLCRRQSEQNCKQNKLLKFRSFISLDTRQV